MTQKLSWKENIDELYPKIAGQIKETPLKEAYSLGQLCDCNLFLKLENEQITGSFKLRGVASKFSELVHTGSAPKEVAAASTGNHAAAVCHLAPYYNCHPTIFVPETITKSKLNKLQQSEAQIKIEGAQSGESELLSVKYAADHNIPLIHPYNDVAVVAGQGTIGFELIKQLNSFEMVFVPVGGGGLISGIAAYLKETNPEIQVIGVQPENASEMAASIQANQVVPASTLPTLSDGTAGGLDPDTITLDLCKRYVDEFILVSEEEIARGLYLTYKHTRMKVEPAAALTIAGILKSMEKVRDKTVIAIICGGNIAEERFEKIIAPYHD
ncbi:MAG: threonine ammonia-lyase [Cyclobacteriaceae bacterium]